MLLRRASPGLLLGALLVAIALVLFTLFAFMWAGIVLGLPFRSADAVQGAGFTVMLPLTCMRAVALLRFRKATA